MSLFLFPGTFDPMTRGHLDLLDRTLRLADRVVIAVAVHPDKTTLFTPEQRAIFWKTALGERSQRTEVVVWEGLTADLAVQLGAAAVVRGVRDGVDLVWEQRLHEANRHLLSDFETVLFPANPDFRWISSSLVREMLRRGQSVEKMVPPDVMQVLNSAAEQIRGKRS